ncbi:MAG: hypothetical protein IJ678_06100, partial [Kiritimatiellae bacterium]|nr:hypothetical protein [Kiritimatiellia bacterium]
DGAVQIGPGTNLTPATIQYRGQRLAYAGDLAFATNRIEALGESLATHTGNTTAHVTAAERARWNGAQQASRLGADVVSICNAAGFVTADLAEDMFLTFTGSSGQREVLTSSGTWAALEETYRDLKQWFDLLPGFGSPQLDMDYIIWESGNGYDLMQRVYRLEQALFSLTNNAAGN